MKKTVDRLEYMTAQEVFYDFCLWEYKPVIPYETKFRPVNLLFHSFDVAGVNERIFDFVQAIREGIGVSNTVWGVKQLGDDIRWEFYFYDYRRRERDRSITKLFDIIRPFIHCGIKANENYHYFMFSIDISDDLISGDRDLEEIHIYLGNPGSAVSSGICYSFTKSGTKLENFYFFFDAKKQMEDILGKIACSAYIDSKVIPIAQILWPEMINCGVIVVANKQHNDSVYFSRIHVDQLLFFLKKMKYPGELVFFIEENKSKLNHLLYDVGYDYRMEGKDLKILKSGYYGIF
jgi:hypothetical protein